MPCSSVREQKAKLFLKGVTGFSWCTHRRKDFDIFRILLRATLNRTACTSASWQGKGQVQLHGLFKVRRILCIVKSCAAWDFELVLLTEGEGHKVPNYQTFQATKGIFFLDKNFGNKWSQWVSLKYARITVFCETSYYPTLSSSETPLAVAGSWWYTYAMCKGFVIPLVSSANRLCSCLFN